MRAADLRLMTSYDASPEEVFALITDATFQEQVCERTRALSYDVDVHTVDGDTLVRVRSEISATELPRPRSEAGRPTAGRGADQDLASGGS